MKRATRCQDDCTWLPKAPKRWCFRFQKKTSTFLLYQQCKAKYLTVAFSLHVTLSHGGKEGFVNSLPVLCVSPVTPFYPACRSQTHFSASVDDNECQNVTNICGQRGNCTNTPGSYYCTCLPGHKSTGKAEFQPNDGTECNGRINDTSEVVLPLAPPAGVPPVTHAFLSPSDISGQRR